MYQESEVLRIAFLLHFNVSLKRGLLDFISLTCFADKQSTSMSLVKNNYQLIPIPFHYSGCGHISM
jgi:hypothetical protein